MFSYSKLSQHAGVVGPAIGVTILVITVFVLVIQATIRPWSDDNYGPDTHLNTRDELDGYNRTELIHVGDISEGPAGWVPSQEARDSAFAGYAAYVGYGCAACHGMDGAGTSVGPSINGTSERRLNNLVRQGPKTMPAYDDVHLVDEDLDLIVSYLSSRPVASPTPEPLIRATATPFPVSATTPAPFPTETSVVATPAPGATATPTSQPETPTPTPPAVDPARFNTAKILFLDVGCDICHGEAGQGGPDGPTLEDLTGDYIREFVRDPRRSADSSYSEAMDPYDVLSLSEEELDEIIFFLLNLE